MSEKTICILFFSGSEAGKILIQAISQADKAEYPIPMFVNAALIPPNYVPGRYNSGGPLPHSFDIWRVGCPHIDFFAPDIYFTNFIEWTNLYIRQGNPLFIPETLSDSDNAFYAYGALDCIGLSPFGIDSSLSGRELAVDNGESPLAMCYKVLAQLSPMILKHNGTQTQSGSRGGVGPRGALGSRSSRAGAIIISLGPDEYLIAGNSLTIEFMPRLLMKIWPG